MTLFLASVGYAMSFLIFSLRGPTRTALSLLVVASLALRLFVAALDPFLHQWDEQYHALVAANLLAHPLTPTLYDDPIRQHDYRLWTENHVWLHKQPLSLWLIALSLGGIGLNELGVRMPSVLLGTALVPVVYRLGCLFRNAETGYLAALLVSVSPYQLGMIAGRLPLDHVDVAFVFCVTASLWALVEYVRRPTAGWAAVCGFLCGLAILTKWLAGLLAFLPWLVARSTTRIHGHALLWRHFLLAAAIAAGVALPWQIYTFATFPEEALQELWYASRHLSSAVERHGGGFLFHLQQLPSLYGKLGAYLLLPALLLFWRRVTLLDRIIYFSAVLATYGFFSLAATKMPAYCLIVSGLLYVALGSLLAELVHHARLAIEPMPARVAVIATALGLLAYLSSNLPRMQRESKHYDEIRLSAQAFRSLRESDAVSATVLFGCPPWYTAAAMFYTGRTAYESLPSPADMAALKRRHLRAVRCRDGEEMPSAIRAE